MRDEGAGQLLGGLQRGEVALEAVMIVDVAEGLVDDARTLRGVSTLDRSELDGAPRSAGADSVVVMMASPSFMNTLLALKRAAQRRHQTMVSLTRVALLSRPGSPSFTGY